MVRGTPKKLARKEYYAMGNKEKGAFWLTYLSKQLGISAEEVRRRINRNNRLPIKEYEELSERYDFTDGSRSIGYEPAGMVATYPRLAAHASLLAQASKGYDGPRGPRPVLASAENIYRLAVFPRRHEGWRTEFFEEQGSIDKFLIDMELTASNPYEWGKIVEFSSEDIRRGIYIPKSIDIEVARALGIIYADGYLNESVLRLTGRYANSDLYKNIIPCVMQDAFNFLKSEPNENECQSNFSDRTYKFVRHGFSSVALAKYLEAVHNFPKSEDEKKERGLSKYIQKLRGALCQEFLKYYLGAKATFGSASGIVAMADISEPVLGDVKGIVINLGFSPSIGIYPNGEGSYQMHLGRATSMELYYSGFLDVNQGIRDKIRDYIDKSPRRSELYARRYRK